MLFRRVLLSACLASAPFAIAEDEPPRTASISGVPTVPSIARPSDASLMEPPSFDAEPVVAADALTGQAAKQFQIQTLKQVLATVREVDGYTAELSKQERIGGELSDVQRIRMKLRHAPHSVYMKWLSGDKGREAIYVHGRNDNEMLVHAGGWRARFLPVLSVDPAGSLAMRESRHPVTEAGLLGLAAKWLEARQADAEGMTYAVETDTFDGAVCHKLTATYASADLDPVYSRVTLWVDAGRLVPLAAVNHGWEDGNALVERYEYRDINLDATLTDADFDRANRQYAFRK